MAFVLITAELGKESELMEQLNGPEEIKEVYAVYGVYDIIARVEAENMLALKEVISLKIRRLNEVRSTLTMIVV